MSKRIIICADCGGRKEHKAHGLCVSCYERGRGRPIIICKECGNQREHGGHGLCKRCYKRQWRRATGYKSPMITCGECGERQPHNADGLCSACYRRRYYREHHERCLTRARHYREKNRNKVRALWRRHKARKKARRRAVANTLTPGQREFEREIGQATYPGKELHLHHVVPTSKGGGHTWGNITFIPALLNISIKDKLPEEVYRQRTFL